MLSLYNTLSRKIEEFYPIEPPKAGMYTCGPTVYHYAHIGNLRTYVFEDVLKRVLAYDGYEVKHVMNITDVGHLTSDSDTGQDKMEKGALREGKSVWEIAQFYTEAFLDDIERLNILPSDILAKATDHIPEQIAQIEELEKRGVTYVIGDGVYFDTSKIANYGKLARLDIEKLRAGARVEMAQGKKNPTDFALWKFSPKNEKRQMEWPSPWGVGFPGWHIECSAMSMKYLGDQFDIHAGGIDHIPVHHTNEIAQAETATGKIPWVRYWLHGEFVVINEERMAKSGGNFITLETLRERGISPLGYRYWLLSAHYRSPINFNWEALLGAEIALNKINEFYLNLGDPYGIENDDYKKKFQNYIDNDLDTPKAVALLWELIKDEKISDADKKATVLDFDRVLGLGLEKLTPVIITPELQKIIDERERARKEKDFKKSDDLRDQIAALGYTLKDTPAGPKISKI